MTPVNLVSGLLACIILCGPSAAGVGAAEVTTLPGDGAVSASVEDLRLKKQVQLRDRKKISTLLAFLEGARPITRSTFLIGTPKYSITLTEPDGARTKVLLGPTWWAARGQVGSTKPGWEKFLLSLFPPESPAEARRKLEKKLTQQIAQATALAYRGHASAAETERAEAAMKLLEQNKDAAAEYLISAMARDDAAKPLDLRSLGVANYSMVLWRFGQEYVCRLEPGVLGHPSPRVRRAAVYILGRGGGRRRGKVVDLAVKVLRRDKDPAVQVEAIRALDNLRASERHAAVRPYLSSPNASLRRQAVLFFQNDRWRWAESELKEMLKTESDRGVCFWVARALAAGKDFNLAFLLRSDKPGVRQGALYELTRRRTAELRGAVYWEAALPLFGTEADALCRAQLAYLFASKGRPECIPLLLDMLQWRKQPEGDGLFLKMFRWPKQTEEGSGYYTSRGSGHYTPAQALSRLERVTGLQLRLTDEDRRRARHEGANLYERVANEAEQWYRRHRASLRWDEKQRRFVVQPRP